MPATAIFQHYGISPWEVEVIYDTLRRSFEVDEKQLQPDDPQYVSMIEIRFPLQYGELFFQEFTMESWFKIKGVIKEVKSRRGKKGLKAFVRFAGFGDGQDVDLVFPLLSKGDRQFQMGIEKLEYMVDVVPTQLKTIPPEAEEIWYSYDEATYRWSPSVAKSGAINYLFKNGEWMKIK
ncbi:MAG TPA: hypothetical protein VNI77_11395 [Nitrososphaera sp.]|nr:hypothetical protein [Nitrososphaera sp.]